MTHKESVNITYTDLGCYSKH